MKILICNDDGYLAHGLSILARVASEVTDINGESPEVRVVAPEQDRSGVSNSLTLDRPLRLRQAGNGFYFVNGTPADCILLALHAMPDYKPDLVLSGINHGANMGDDTLYSGTVAAATEAYLSGIPAVAFSLNDRQNRYWNTAEHVVRQLLSYLLAHLPTQPMLWNINVPARAQNELQGWKVARLGRRHRELCMIPAPNPRGEHMFWLGAAGNGVQGEAGTDFAESEAGFVTLTPLSTDLTDTPHLDSMQQFWQDVRL